MHRINENFALTKVKEIHKIPRVPILMYHEVSNIDERAKNVRDTNPVYTILTRRFSEQMEYLHQNHIRTTSLSDLINGEMDGKEKAVIITFDDGWENVYTNAFPILKGYNMSATIFVITGFIGQPEYLDWHQIREMSEGGVSIQSHTGNHKPLVGLKNGQILHELEGSKKIIEDNLGKEVKFLSVPHGMINRKVIDVAQALGYKGICTSEPGFSHSYSSPAIFKRINIPDNYEMSTFEKIVRANRGVILPAIFSKKIKNLVKTVIGYQNYRKIYHLWYRIENY